MYFLSSSLYPSLTSASTNPSLSQVHTAVQQTGFKRVKRGFRPLRLPESLQAAAAATDPRDPYFPLQWYLKNTGQNGGKPKLDLNVEAAWAQGYTGVNVTTAIMDDGELVGRFVDVIIIGSFRMFNSSIFLKIGFQCVYTVLNKTYLRTQNV